MAKKRQTMKQAAEDILNMKLAEDSDVRRELEQHGLAATGAQAVLWAVFRKALGGDVSAAKLIREISNEKDEAAAGSLPSAASAELSALSDEELIRIIAGEKK